MTLHKLEKAGVKHSELVEILNNVPVNIIITDAEGDILWCNDTACKFTGYLKKEIIGENPRILKSDLNDEKIYEEMWDTIKNQKKIWKGTIKNKKKNGEIYEEVLQIIPIIENTKPIRFIGIQKDVTEMEKLRKRESVKEALKLTVEQIEKIHKKS
jgi:two-component system sensor histidine kinase/response regulator